MQHFGHMKRGSRSPFHLACGLFLAFLCGCSSPAAQDKHTPQPGTLEPQETSATDDLAAPDSLPSFSKDELLGHFDPAQHASFSRIPDAWTDKERIYLRKETLEAYGRMREAALADGVHLLIRSATRNFIYQRSIWERKWKRPQYMGWQAVDKARDILTYSAMPGASRHHWGTDIDLNSFENEWFETGEGAEIYGWLSAHAGEFGFHQVYDDKSTGRKGYELERWHWSYMPIAGPMLAVYNEMVVQRDLLEAEFSGSETAESLRVLSDFVNGIDQPED